MHMDIIRYIQARFTKTERGAALVEYALLLALIAVVCIIALTTLGKGASSKFDTISQSITKAGSSHARRLLPGLHDGRSRRDRQDLGARGEDRASLTAGSRPMSRTSH